jgi:hypothetical protein
LGAPAGEHPGLNSHFFIVEMFEIYSGHTDKFADSDYISYVYNPNDPNYNPNAPNINFKMIDAFQMVILIE